MKEITIKQKIISTIVTVNDGRLDDLSLGELYQIVDFLLTKDSIFKVYDQAIRLTKSCIDADHIEYIADVISEVLQYE